MKKILVALALVLLGIFGYIVFAGSPPSAGNAYISEKYGISFDYPDGYVLREGEQGNGERGHYAITLIREEDSEPRINSEGPTAITIDIYQNNLDKLPLVSWLTGTNQSNYKLSSQPYASTTADGAEAVSYRWSGLYEGETVAFLHNENIVAVSVTFITPEDENVAVYRDIVRSLRLINPAAPQESFFSDTKNV